MRAQMRAIFPVLAATAAAFALAACAGMSESAPASNDSARIALAPAQINSAHVEEDRTITLGARSGDVYRVTLAPPCDRTVMRDDTVVFSSFSTDTLDRNSPITVGERTCMVQSITRAPAMGS